MIRFGKVEIENFLSIRKGFVDFSERGLVAVLGPNGSGKSSLVVESLLAGLFGVTERYGVERDRVVNRFVGKDCHIHIPLKVDELSASVDFYRAHHKFKDEIFFEIDGQDKRGRTNRHTWDKIIKFLDMDALGFTNCAVFGQSLARYLSLDDAKQKAIVERLLGLSWIPKAYELSSKDYNSIDSQLDSLTGQHEMLTKKIAEYTEQLGYYNEKLTRFSIEKANRIKELEDSFLEPEDTKELEGKIKELEKKVSVDEALLSDHSQNEEKLRDLDLAVRELETKARSKEAEIEKIESKKQVLKRTKVEGEVRCDACGQKITVESKESFIEHLTKDIGVKTEELRNYQKEIKEKKRERDPLEENRNNLLQIERSSKLIFQSLSRYKADLSAVQVRNARVDEKNNNILKRIEEIKVETSSFQEVIDKLNLDIASCSADLDDLIKQYKVKEEEEKYAKELVELYSNHGFKSFVIESCFPDMDRFAHTYSTALGGKYEIKFSPQTQLKSGEMREKFYAGVINRYGSESYDGNSAGEKSAIDAIILFVLGDLAANRFNKRVSLLILDDVFEKLDDTACESIIHVLELMATKKESRDEEFKDLPERESIFVLTHLEQFKSRIENRILIKDNTNLQV